MSIEPILYWLAARALYQRKIESINQRPYVPKIVNVLIRMGTSCSTTVEHTPRDCKVVDQISLVCP